jgi:short-subunit dehydrogenase
MTPAQVNYSQSTVIVTGGSSGIGQAIATELVTRGVKRIVIVAHGQEKLDKAASQLAQVASGVEVKTISADLASHDAASDIKRQIDQWGWQIDILVNNAGLARKQRFAENKENDVSLRTVDVMIRTVVDLSLHFLPSMVERGSGGILNVCSTACFQPVPFTAIYAASKAFMLSWSQAIREENIDTGVRIAAIVPGITDTNLDGAGHGERRGALDAVGIDQPETVAKAAVDAYEANSAQQIVGTNNWLLKSVMGFVPDSIKASLVASARGAPEGSDDVGASGE